MRYKTKEIIKLVVVVLLFLAIIGLVVGAFGNSKVDKDGKVEPELNYEVGALTSYGKFSKAEDSLYTYDAFKCKGLVVKLDFDATVKYQIYYYDENEQFISSTDVLDSSYKEQEPQGAVFARIVIYPIFDTDDTDHSIGYFEKNRYINQLQVKVDNVQEEKTDTTTE